MTHPFLTHSISSVSISSDDDDEEIRRDWEGGEEASMNFEKGRLAPLSGIKVHLGWWTLPIIKGWSGFHKKLTEMG